MVTFCLGITLKDILENFPRVQTFIAFHFSLILIFEDYEFSTISMINSTLTSYHFLKQLIN